MHSTAQRIVDEALAELPGCPRPLAAAALRDTLRDFLRRSQVLRVDLTAIDIVADDYTYTLTLPAGYDGFAVYRPTLVLLNGAEQRAGIDYRMQDRTTLQLRDTPTAADTGGLEVTVSLAMDDEDTADLTDIEDWYPVIAAGMKSRLMIAPGKPWSNPAAAAVYRHEYNDGLGKAISHALTDGMGVPQRLSM